MTLVEDRYDNTCTHAYVHMHICRHAYTHIHTHMHTLETSEDAEEPIFARFALFAFSKLSVTEHLLCKGTMVSTFEHLCLFEKCLGNVIFSLRIYIHIHTYRYTRTMDSTFREFVPLSFCGT